MFFMRDKSGRIKELSDILKIFFKKVLTNTFNYAIILLVIARYARLAQLVEHLTLNQGVWGSSPQSRTNLRSSRTNLFNWSATLFLSEDMIYLTAKTRWNFPTSFILSKINIKRLIFIINSIYINTKTAGGVNPLRLFLFYFPVIYRTAFATIIATSARVAGASGRKCPFLSPFAIPMRPSFSICSSA